MFKDGAVVLGLEWDFLTKLQFATQGLERNQINGRRCIGKGDKNHAFSLSVKKSTKDLIRAGKWRVLL